MIAKLVQFRNPETVLNTRSTDTEFDLAPSGLQHFFQETGPFSEAEEIGKLYYTRMYRFGYRMAVHFNCINEKYEIKSNEKCLSFYQLLILGRL